MSKKELPTGIINPFSDVFLETWDFWKRYKMEEFKFKYKGCLSEQAALMQLSELSGSDEITAVAIIKQSMSNGWKGLFELKNKNNGTGQSTTKSGEKYSTDNLKEKLATRFGGR